MQIQASHKDLDAMAKDFFFSDKAGVKLIEQLNELLHSLTFKTWSFKNYCSNIKPESI